MRDINRAAHDDERTLAEKINKINTQGTHYLPEMHAQMRHPVPHEDGAACMAFGPVGTSVLIQGMGRVQTQFASDSVVTLAGELDYRVEQHQHGLAGTLHAVSLVVGSFSGGSLRTTVRLSCGFYKQPVRKT